MSITTSRIELKFKTLVIIGKQMLTFTQNGLLTLWLPSIHKFHGNANLIRWNNSYLIFKTNKFSIIIPQKSYLQFKKNFLWWQLCRHQFRTTTFYSYGLGGAWSFAINFTDLKCKKSEKRINLILCATVFSWIAISFTCAWLTHPL